MNIALSFLLVIVFFVLLGGILYQLNPKNAQFINLYCVVIGTLLALFAFFVHNFNNNGNGPKKPTQDTVYILPPDTPMEIPNCTSTPCGNDYRSKQPKDEYKSPSSEDDWDPNPPNYIYTPGVEIDREKLEKKIR